MGKEYEIKLKFGHDLAAENSYMALATAVQMLRSFAGNVSRFRNNYLETFSTAEEMFMQQENCSRTEAIEWTERNLEIYFANLQNIIYAVATKMAEDYEFSMPLDHNALLEIDGHEHIDTKPEAMLEEVELPEELRRQLEAMFGEAPSERN